MNTIIKRFSYYSLIGFITLILTNIIQLILPEDSLGAIRRLKAILGYFVFLPILCVTTYFSIAVLNYYLKYNFKLPKKYFLITLPFLIYFTLGAILLIYTIFIGTIISN